MSAAKHTPEPWPIAKGGDVMLPFADGSNVYLRKAVGLPLEDYERARACVNACAGMANPAAEISVLRGQEESRQFEARAHAKALQARDSLAAELRNIANAKPLDWPPECRDEFQAWAQSRARYTLAKFELG